MPPPQNKSKSYKSVKLIKQKPPKKLDPKGKKKKDGQNGYLQQIQNGNFQEILHNLRMEMENLKLEYSKDEYKKVIFTSFIYGDGFNEVLEIIYDQDVNILMNALADKYNESRVYSLFSTPSTQAPLLKQKLRAEIHDHSLLFIVPNYDVALFLKQTCENMFTIEASDFLKDIINIFPGYRLIITQNNIEIGFIFIEISDSVNIELMNQYFKFQNKLNIDGFIATHYLMREMQVTYRDDLDRQYRFVKDYLFICYDILKHNNNFDIINFLTKVNEIFGPSSNTSLTQQYAFISSNIFTEMLSYLNPKDITLVNSGEKLQDYNELDTRLNSDTIEQKTSTFGDITLRCLLNHFIMYINNEILVKRNIGFASKSGGEVYRYYGLGDRTNDIDAKIFFNPLKRGETANAHKEAQKDILKAMFALREIIQRKSFNALEYDFEFEIFNATVRLQYRPVKDDCYYTRIRSILIEIANLKQRNADYLYENGGIRLFSLDWAFDLTVYIQSSFNGGSYYSYNSRATTSPLDVAFQPLPKFDYTQSPILQHNLTENVSINILSPQYLIADLELLLSLPERKHKNHKDIARKKYLEDNSKRGIVDTIGNQLSSLCDNGYIPPTRQEDNMLGPVESRYIELTRNLESALTSQKSIIDKSVELFEQYGLTLDMTDILPKDRAKTSFKKSVGTHDTKVIINGFGLEVLDDQNSPAISVGGSGYIKKKSRKRNKSKKRNKNRNRNKSRKRF